MANLIKGLVLAIVLIDCSWLPGGQDAHDPQGRLMAYITRSFKIQRIEEKAELLSMLTGKVRSKLESWSEDQFREAYMDSKREFVKLVFKDIRPISKTEVQITYEISFLDYGNKPETSSARITNRKLAKVVEEKGKWLISEVRNLREMIEFQDEMSLP